MDKPEVDKRIEEIQELCALGRVSQAYADFHIRLGTPAADVRRDLFAAVANDPQHPLKGVMREQVKRGI